MGEFLSNSNSFMERKLKAAIALVRNAHILPKPFASHGDHFIHEDPEQIGYTAIETLPPSRMITREDHPEIYEQLEFYFNNQVDYDVE